ncbi:hypothetical protein P8452_56566 [Trifolium repens]|nr:hypothetical protein P8452_56566 [Trifolium repens]
MPSYHDRGHRGAVPEVQAASSPVAPDLEEDGSADSEGQELSEHEFADEEEEDVVLLREKEEGRERSTLERLSFWRRSAGGVSWRAEGAGCAILIRIPHRQICVRGLRSCAAHPHQPQDKAEGVQQKAPERSLV